MDSYVLDLQEIGQSQAAIVGGKVAHLGELSRIDGLRVPAGFCVTTEAFRRIMADAPCLDERLDQLSRLRPDDREPIRTRQRGDPRGDRGDRHPRRSGRGDHRRARPARRASRLRRALQRDGGGPADGLLRRPAGHLPEHRGAAGDPSPHQPVLGLALHRAGRDLPPAQRLRPPDGPHGRGRAADGLPGGRRHPLHGRPRHVQPEDLLRGGQPRSRRGAGLRPGERGRVPGARRRGHLPDDRHQAARHPRPPWRRDAAGGDRTGTPGPAHADRCAGGATRASWVGGSRRTSAVPRTSSGAWPTTTSRSSRAGRSPRCSRSPRLETTRSTSSSRSVTSR